MAIGDIQHSELPDNLLHEPKGASTASANTAYIADGEGSGSFMKVPVAALDMTIPSVADVEPTTITPTVVVNHSSLSQTPLNFLSDVEAFSGIPQQITQKINYNAAQFAAIYDNQVQINNNIRSAISNLETKLNQLIDSLKGIGLLDD